MINFLKKDKRQKMAIKGKREAENILKFNLQRGRKKQGELENG